MKNQYRYSIVTHHQKRYTHTYSKVGSRDEKVSVARGREGPGAPKGLSSEQRALGPCSNYSWIVIEGRKLSQSICIDGSSRAGK